MAKKMAKRRETVNQHNVRVGNRLGEMLGDMVGNYADEALRNHQLATDLEAAKKRIAELEAGKGAK